MHDGSRTSTELPAPKSKTETAHLLVGRALAVILTLSSVDTAVEEIRKWHVSKVYAIISAVIWLICLILFVLRRRKEGARSDKGLRYTLEQFPNSALTAGLIAAFLVSALLVFLPPLIVPDPPTLDQISIQALILTEQTRIGEDAQYIGSYFTDDAQVIVNRFGTDKCGAWTGFGEKSSKPSEKNGCQYGNLVQYYAQPSLSNYKYSKEILPNSILVSDDGERAIAHTITVFTARLADGRWTKRQRKANPDAVWKFRHDSTQGIWKIEYFSGGLMHEVADTKYGLLRVKLNKS